MKKLMVATDFSERSDRALRRATLLARQFGATITLIHVVDDDHPRRIVDAEHAAASTLLQQMAATLLEVDGVECESHVVLASPFAGIIEAVENMRPDLLVIGPHRRQVLKDVFIGTTAERLIRLVSCPVLMVNAPPAGRYRHVMQTTDLSESSCDALQRFPALGIGKEARNTLLHIFNAPALRLVMSHAMPKGERDRYLADEQKAASRDLEEFVVTAKLGNVLPKVRYEAAVTHLEILTAAESEKADLIVVSTHGRTGLAKLLIGSVTEKVLLSSSIDVLAIPPMRSK
ncbi:universal stress protein [Hoeflea sp. YIM 152468]|uniref:universal stress protein n=1 Tax=Hoeflea sp. YIM 152468 TaxID=3031759 RepID=UPI0023D97A02|nr:universal stress protein [Hoeflea sp. YIM 152468]MDF1609332.1 universal stress protein [Hoeflea sp. YIM 152468]